MGRACCIAFTIFLAACRYGFDLPGAGLDDADGGSPDATAGPAGPDGPVADAAPSPDAAPSCPDSMVPFETSNFSRCEIPDPGRAIIVQTGELAVIDTDLATFENNGPIIQLEATVVPQIGGPDLLLVSTNRMEVQLDGYLAFTGDRPLAIVSFSDIQIVGTVDIGAFDIAEGPGASPNNCSFGDDGVAQMAADTFNVAGSGGGGGGFGSSGGNGANVPTVGMDSNGGTSNGTATIEPLRGGCQGGDGGDINGGTGGGGGGALQLVAVNLIDIPGTLTSPGGGGQPASGPYGGGAGGGSGGALLVESPAIRISGNITANGGGGGEGLRGGSVADPGEDGHAFDANPALGGANVSAFAGGDGGSGATGLVDAQRGFDGDNDNRSCGSGGGGGGVGRIRLSVDPMPEISGLVSPDPVIDG